MRDEEIHGDIFAIDVFVDDVPNRGRHEVGVRVHVIFMQKRRAGQHHR